MLRTLKSEFNLALNFSSKFSYNKLIGCDNMAESIMVDKAKDFAVEFITMCKTIKETKRESVCQYILNHIDTSSVTS